MNSSFAYARLFPLAAPLSLLAVLLLALVSGCTTTTPGPGGKGVVAYGRGELSADVTHDLDTVFAASQRALDELEIIKIDDKKTRVDAQILSRTATDKKIVINLERVTDTLTKVYIKVGVVGDETLSRLILDKMFTELK
jgi:hypothetical protein